MVIFKYLLRFAPVLGVLLALNHGFAVAQNAPEAAHLNASTQSVDLWPAVRILAEPAAALTPYEAMQRTREFVTPTTPHSNLGIRTGAVWVRVKLEMAESAQTRWMFDVDYPSIDRIELYQVDDGAVVREVRMGDSLLLDARPLPSRSHAVELELKPGTSHELLMRVQTTSSMILPITLSQPAQFHAREAGMEALQGLFAGIGICLLIYSLAHWIALRDPVFAYYAGSTAGVTFFCLAYNGLAPQFLWPNSLWLTGNAAPLSVLVALWGGFLFLNCTLRVAELNRLVSRLLIGCGWFALAVAAGFVFEVIDYRTAQLISTALGPMPMLLGLPMTWLRMKQGEGAMRYLFVGWGLYAIGALVMAALLRGYAPSNAITQYAFQVGSTLEMVFWLMLLGQRVEDMRRRAEHDRREHAALRSLAMTDSLTGLLNRRGLAPALAQAISRGVTGRFAAVLMIDLDGFKAVNDRHGHDVGDLLLIAVATRLKAHAGDANCIARLGGDEFAVVAEGFGAESDAEEFGRKVLAALSKPFQLQGGRNCAVGATIGYALAPADGRDASILLKRADTAMYEGKQQGKRCLRRYTSPVRLVAAAPKAPQLRPVATVRD
ncbi:MAG: diguanylate cyclase [Usitatibacteraceae bacterium]